MGISFKVFDLRCFVALCSHESFTKAADKMCISQPPFSRIIQKLESEMSGTLIDRSQRSFALTTLGKKFKEEALKIIHDYDNSMHRLEILRGTLSEDIKIGFTSLASQIPGFYELVDTLSAEASKVCLDELPSQILCEKLQTHEIDIGITHFSPNSKSLQVRQINACKAVVLFPQQICCFREKHSYNLILNENKLDKLYNKYLLKNLGSYHLTPLYKGPNQLCPQLALQGRGVLIYPEPTAKMININNSFTLEEIEKKADLFGIYIITHKTLFKGLIEHIMKNHIQL
jgi:DNA-binding transcriptional LysR family regulator